MSKGSKIEWTQDTWNPVTGCTKISDGCKNCYACKLAGRLQRMGNIRYKNGFDVTLHEDILERPYQWKKPRTIFVNSMSDLFHEDIPDEFIKKVFKVMNETPHHKYQILTKREERMASIAPKLEWTDNIWQGVTIEGQDYIKRLDYLRRVPSKIRFISFEPLLTEIKDIDLSGIHWAIIGGESGPGARPIMENWVLSLKEQCLNYNVPFFFKQWGGTNKKKAGRLLLGQTWDASPQL